MGGFQARCKVAYTLIRNATLIDGTGAPPLPEGAVLIHDDRLEAVGREADLELPGTEVRVIDAAGGTILPGFIDTHVHLMFDGIDLMRELTTPFSLRFYQAASAMRRTLEAGITTVRDAGGADVGVKRAVEQGLVTGPRMQISVTVLTTTGGHGDFWMPSGSTMPLFPGYPGNPEGICDGVEGVRRKVREVLRAGAEVIKVCATGGVLSPTDHPSFTQFSPQELRVMVEEGGYRNGVRVMAHAQGAEGIKNAVRAGIRSIEHGIFLDDEAIALMLEHGTFLVPTLLAPLAVLEEAETHGTMPAWGVRKARETIDIHRQSIARAQQAGVAIAMGTDAGVMPHGSNLRELALMKAIGMTPMEALVATTRTAAECLGWEAEVGTLEPGKLADVVLTPVNPLEELGAMADPDNIRLVVKGGVVVKDLLNVASS